MLDIKCFAIYNIYTTKRQLSGTVNTMLSKINLQYLNYNTLTFYQAPAVLLENEWVDRNQWQQNVYSIGCGRQGETIVLHDPYSVLSSTGWTTQCYSLCICNAQDYVKWRTSSWYLSHDRVAGTRRLTHVFNTVILIVIFYYQI